MSLYLNGNIVKGSLVIDGEAFYKATILEGSASTNKWAEPLIYNSVNVLDYEVLCFKGTDQGTPFNLYYTIADLPISAAPTQDNDHTQFSTNGYLYVDANGYLYFCVTTTKTLVLNEVIAYSGKEPSVSGTLIEYIAKNPKANVYIKETNGAEAGYSGWSATDFIEVSGGEVIHFAWGYLGGGFNNIYNACYTSSKQFIQNMSMINGGYATYTMPANAKYIRCSSLTSTLNNTQIWRERNL